MEVVLGFQADGVRLVAKGVASRWRPRASRRSPSSLRDFRELGGTLLVCAPCLKSRGITAPDDLVDGAEVVAAARFVAEVTSATNSLVY